MFGKYYAIVKYELAEKRFMRLRPMKSCLIYKKFLQNFVNFWGKLAA